MIVIMSGSQLHRLQIRFGGSPSDGKSNMIRRTGSRPQRLHLFHQKGNQRIGIQQRLRLLKQVGLVSRPAPLGNAEKFIFRPLCGINIYLSGKIASRVLLVIHIKRHIL
ncbi:hypothetical protein Barb7_02844 [Bacteroidales bacterium Barb7]|nr:hypothetical protein Barb7_02844 [Bacteroidales bacterium Barb7]